MTKEFYLIIRKTKNKPFKISYQITAFKWLKYIIINRITD